MSHSPLLRHFERLARRFARIEFARIDAIDPLRRRWLGALPVVALGASVASSADAATTTKPRAAASIGIVGAGLAGLTAAWALNRAGFGPAVFEAGTRLGGRCWSARDVFDEAQVAERGGEFIDSVHTDAIALAKALGLALDDVLEAETDGTNEITWIDGAPYLAQDADRDFAKVWPIVRRHAEAMGEPTYRGASRMARELDRLSVAQWIERHVPGGRASRLGRALDQAYVEEMAIETTELSAIVIVSALSASKNGHYGAYAGSDQRYHVRGGNDRIVSALAAGLGPAALRLNHRLVAVRRESARRVELVFDVLGAEFRQSFDRVILALPFSTLRDVDLSAAGFRPLKQRAIRELPMGRSTKLQLQFGTRFWNAAGSNGMIAKERSSWQSSWEVTRAQAGASGILNFWSGGAIAVAAGDGSEADAAGRALADLEAVLPGATQHWNGLVIRNAWDREPFVRGSYAYTPPGWFTSLHGIQAEPEGIVHFAGEHTSMESAGYLNGAIDSGQRAAREVAKALGARVPGLPAA
jgi:monoamine oxidase